MQQNPHYRNVLKEVMQFFSAQLELFLAQGANDIILDPGFGFAKKLEHNYELLAQLDQLKMFDRPILVGVSRKSMINKLTGRSAQYALNGTSVVHTLALQNGANLLRVHDVREAVEVVKILTFTQKFT
ncbi:MAG: dihydropteroate synthase [Owenweeksia sp.]|nr:dihydropteroate synthase [Owenweeksia sp.]